MGNWTYTRELKSWEKSSPLKLQVKTTFDFGKLANRTQKLVDDLIQKTVVGESKAMKQRISTGSTITGKMDNISKTTIDIRELRGSSSKKPMHDTGKLHDSIKPKKESISGNYYGSYHQKAHKTVTNKFTKWYYMKTGKNIANKAVPARKWIHDDETFKYDKKIIDSFFKRMGKALKK